MKICFLAGEEQYKMSCRSKRFKATLEWLVLNLWLQYSNSSKQSSKRIILRR